MVTEEEYKNEPKKSAPAKRKLPQWRTDSSKKLNTSKPQKDETEMQENEKAEEDDLEKILYQGPAFSNRKKTDETFQRDLLCMNFCTNDSEQRNVGGLSNYLRHCKTRKMGEFVLKGRRSNFIVETAAAPFFEFQLPELLGESDEIRVEDHPDWIIAAASEVKEVEDHVNLGVLTMFVHRGSISGCIYQPKINHQQLDIGNYTKKSSEHQVTLLETTLGANNFGFDNQSLIKIMPYTIKKRN